MKEKLLNFYNKNQRWLPASFFILGFLFDILTIDRIDSLLQSIQQAAYLLILAVLLFYTLKEQKKIKPLPDKWMRYWKYHEIALQFFFGNLLSSFTLFYFKSASFLNSFVFIIFIVALLILNEISDKFKYRFYLYIFMYTLCVASFWIYVIPSLLGFIGALPFILSMLTSSIFLFAIYNTINKKLQFDLSLKKNIIIPAATIKCILISFYFFNILPPLPLSLKYIGVFHDIKKDSGNYIATYTRPWWKFWQNGDQTFLARSGDKIFTFVSVYSPTGFKEQLRVKWFLRGKRKWELQDTIPLDIYGGREAGFRGFTMKSNYTPGIWRVQIETSDNREIGRLYFDIISDESTDEPNLRQTIL